MVVDVAQRTKQLLSTPEDQIQTLANFTKAKFWTVKCIEKAKNKQKRGRERPNWKMFLLPKWDIFTFVGSYYMNDDDDGYATF